jgi:6-phosphogluconolactonase
LIVMVVIAVWCIAEAASASAAFLTPVAGSPFSTGGTSRPDSVAFSPSGGLLAETNYMHSNVELFTPGNPGFGSPVPTVSGFSGAGAASSVAFSPNGGLLATADASYGVSLFSVNGSTLTPVNGSPFPSGGLANSVAFSPDGSLLATANGTSNSVSLFTVSASGLTAVSGSPFSSPANSQPVSVAFSPSGGGLLAAANAAAGTVSLFTASASALTPVSGSPFATGAGTSSQPYSVAFSPDGSLLAAADFHSNGVSLFTVGSGGLTAAAGSPFSTGSGSGSYSVAFSPGGGLLAAANAGTNNVSLFTVSGSGLTAVAGSPFPAGASPRSIALSGSLLATGNYFDDNVSLFSFPEPSASITTPANAATFTQGQVVAASYACQDAPGGPGIASCTGTVANGASIDTSTAGAHTFTVTAVSHSGLTATATSTYTVTGSGPGAPKPVNPTNPPAPVGKVSTPGKVSSSGVQSVTISNPYQLNETAALIESFNCPVPQWGQCGNTFTPAAVAAKHKVRFHVIIIAKGNKTIAPHRHATIKLKLSRTARRLLRGRHLRVTLRITFMAPGASATVRTRSVLLHY